MRKPFSKWAVPHLNQGGVPDLNDPTNRDTVPAMLTKGEFVNNKESTQMFGPLLNHLNNLGLQQRHAENQQIMRNMGGPLALNPGGKVEKIKSGIAGIIDFLVPDDIDAPIGLQPGHREESASGIFGFGKSYAVWDGQNWISEKYNEPVPQYVADQINKRLRDQFEDIADKIKETGELTPELAEQLEDLGVNKEIIQPVLEQQAEQAALQGDINKAQQTRAAIDSINAAEGEQADIEAVKDNLIDTGETLGYGKTAGKLLFNPENGTYYRQRYNGEIKPVGDKANYGNLSDKIKAFEERTGVAGGLTKKRVSQDIPIRETGNAEIDWANMMKDINKLREEGKAEPAINNWLESAYPETAGNQNWATDEGEQEMQDLIESIPQAPKADVPTEEGNQSIFDVLNSIPGEVKLTDAQKQGGNIVTEYPAADVIPESPTTAPIPGETTAIPLGDPTVPPIVEGAPPVLTPEQIQGGNTPIETVPAEEVVDTSVNPIVTAPTAGQTTGFVVGEQEPTVVQPTGGQVVITDEQRQGGNAPVVQQETVNTVPGSFNADGTPYVAPVAPVGGVAIPLGPVEPTSPTSIVQGAPVELTDAQRMGGNIPIEGGEIVNTVPGSFDAAGNPVVSPSPVGTVINMGQLIKQREEEKKKEVPPPPMPGVLPVPKPADATKYVMDYGKKNPYVTDDKGQKVVAGFGRPGTIDRRHPPGTVMRNPRTGDTWINGGENWQNTWTEDWKRRK